MNTHLEKIIYNASGPLGSGNVILNEWLKSTAGLLAADFENLLKTRNGFYALEGALHVFPLLGTDFEIGLEKWNSEDLWRNAYLGMADGCLFFAQDIFGGQFCLKDGKIHTFDPETGNFEYFAKNIDEWAKLVVEDCEVLTGYPLAHQWQQQHGQLQTGMRLQPKVPFILGGEFSSENLFAANAVESMRFRALLATQLKDAPDAAQVSFKTSA